jgi:hypothetical protein
MAKYSGSGWHNQSIRHSNARKYGRAGGRYAKHYGEPEKSEWQIQHDKQTKEYRKRLDATWKQMFQERLNLKPEFLEKIKPYEDELLSLWIDQEQKQREYDDADEWKAYGRGKKAGAIKRSYNTAYSKLIDRIIDLIGIEREKDTGQSVKVVEYLDAKAHETGLFENQSFSEYNVPFKAKGKGLEIIAKDIVKKVGEWDEEKNACTGACIKISEQIGENLSQNGYKFPDEVHLIEPMLKVKGGFAFGEHKALILPKQKLIIDTQLWQMNKQKPTDLKKRKVIFTFEEYKKKGLTW